MKVIGDDLSMCMRVLEVGGADFEVFEKKY